MKLSNFLGSPRFWGVCVASKTESYKFFLAMYLLKFLMAYSTKLHAYNSHDGSSSLLLGTNLSEF